jgi:predicted HNH restriction endonuclease
MQTVGLMTANPSEEMHHIVAIVENENKRMDPSNWLALCRSCHEALEYDVMAGMTVKRWSESNYEEVLNGNG